MKNEGNSDNIINVMKRAAAGEPVTVGFIGGSITQGAVASEESLCYAARVYKWWKESFPASDVRYVNAGIGATTSQFGVARAGDDLLKYCPDFIIVEFSVNDNDEGPYERSDFFRETYEGLIRKLLSSKNGSGFSPALLIVLSVRYDDGSSMEDVHAEIGRHYGIPCISMKELIYDRIDHDTGEYMVSGRESIRVSDITPDMLHPNDLGHGIVAGHITDYLDTLKCEAEKSLKGPDRTKLKPALTENAYKSVIRHNRLNSHPVLKGFTEDTSEVMKPFTIDAGLSGRETEKNGKTDIVFSSEVRDVFKNGWSASDKGDSISFEFTGRELAVMYRKSVKKPAPIAYAVIDGDEESRTCLDANFDEDWGDKAYMKTLVHHGVIIGEKKMADKDVHELTITIEDAERCIVDFYLICVLW